MPRMKILNATEQEAFEKPPIFNARERKRFFDFPSELLDTAQRLRTPCHRIGFLLMCVYFQVTKKFFNLEDYHLPDIESVARKLGFESRAFSAKGYLRSRIHHHRQLILEICGYRRFDIVAEKGIMLEISPMIRAQLKPKFIFWRCLDLLIKNRTQLPNYDQLSKIILSALNQRKRKLAIIIDLELTLEARLLLDGLFSQDTQNVNTPQYARYRLTLLKKLSQSTKPFKVKERVDDLFYLKKLYGHLKGILCALELGPEGIRYYANSVIKADIFQLKQRAHEDRYIYVISFIVHQYYRLQDNLADVLLTVGQSHQNSSAREHRDWCYENRKIRDHTMESLLRLLEDGVFYVFSDIRAALENKEATDTEKITNIEQLMRFPNQAIEKSKALKVSLEEVSGNKTYFKIMENRSFRLQNRLSPIVKALDFQGEPKSSALVEAIVNFKKKDGNVTQYAPSGFLDASQQAAVNADGTFRRSLYKVFLFMHIASALKSGMLNLKHSHKYRPLDDYMIPKERWEKDRAGLIKQAELQGFTVPSPLLAHLDNALYQQYQMTNKLYLEGKNPYLKIGTNNQFTIATPKQEEQENTVFQPLFPEQPIPLTEVLSTVNQHTGFLKEFRHWQQRYTKNRATDKTLYAGIIGKGCAIGTPKIARISSQINEGNLAHVINWYFSLENIQAANDRVIKLMDGMELPEIYRRSKETLHTSSDGQKFTVRADSLNANYSFKYCGKEQGVSAYTFLDERNLLWHSIVFSAADRESAYVIDGLMRNDVVKSDIHSTDTHGYSEAIFAVTYLLGFSYAPRIKNLKKQTLYIFKSRKKFDQTEWGITPDKYIDQVIIEETWDDILRLVTTIKLKETTASEIFRRLNSYSKQHRLYRGLKAFGQIIKSKFILRYLDDLGLRQAIEKQLNKVELANRFTRDVAVGNPREFTQGEKEEQEIAEACNRLIKNSIICWNYLYLSDRLERLEKQPAQYKTLLATISTHSVMSWAHINMLGEYDFSDEKLKDSFGIRSPKLLR